MIRLLVAVILAVHVYITEGAGCPQCNPWTGISEIVCGKDGMTYNNHCELLVSLCQQGIITLGDGVDINSIPVIAIVSGYVANKGKCSDDSGGGNCPDCVGVPAQVVCDSSLNQFDNMCELAKELCSLSVIAFDDGVDFSEWTNDDYFSRCQNFVGWDGPCTGPCDAGKYSLNGEYPCRECGPGTYQDRTGQTDCAPCPKGSYQSEVGSVSCELCPDTQTTTQIGSDDVTDCKDGCAPGSVSDTGLEPCQLCPAGHFQSVTGGSTCNKCGTGTFSSSPGTAYCSSCDPGTYAPTAGAASCLSCPAGAASPDPGSAACNDCGPGTYSNSSGSDYCDLCGKGAYSNGNQNTACQDCAAGHYADEEGSASCLPCPSGTYAGGPGTETCTPCVGGTYSGVEGATSCTACPAGSISKEGASSCHSCPAGTHSLNNVCEKCPENSFSNGDTDTCTPCPDGQISAEGSSKCVDCGKGSYLNPAGNCEQCPPGFYSDTIGAAECSPCPEGYFSATLGSTYCTPCGAGHYSNSTDASSCTMCHPGTFNPNTGAKACDECPIGTYTSQSAALYCLDCRPGTFGNETGQFQCYDCEIGSYQTAPGQGSCDLCPKGQYNTVAGATYCMMCRPGMYSDQAGASHCLDCPKGYHAGDRGSEICDACPTGTFNMYTSSPYCTDCPPGTYANTTGSVICHDCPSGHHNPDTSGDTCTPCPKGSHAEEDGSHHCTDCPAGSFADEEGSATCQPCDPGSVAFHTGQETCTLCPAGKFAALNGTTSCSTCKTGSYSGEGASTCTLCPKGHHGDTTEAKECKECPPGHYAGVEGLVHCVPCSIGDYSPNSGAETCDPCPAGSYSDVESATSCNLCPAGQASSGGSSACEDCAAGTYSDAAGTAQCPACPAGTFSDAVGSKYCSPCPAGTYSSEGSDSCIPCDAGTYSASSGAAQCTECAVGTFQDLTGQKSCKACEKGSFLDLTGQKSCKSCPAGQFTDREGQVACSSCPAGSFSDQAGTVQCTLCPKGQVSSSEGSTKCGACVQGTVAKVEGMTRCMDCGPGAYSPGSGGIICKKCAEGTYSAAQRAGSCSLCAPGSYAQLTGSASCTACPVGTYADTAGTVTCKQCENSINTDIGQTTCEQCEKGTKPNAEGTECDPYNVALHKPATLSTVHSGEGEASHGTDGDNNPNFWHHSCFHSVTENSPWWKVDLQDTFPIREVVVTNRKDCCADRIDGFQIHVGNTGTSADPVCGDELISSDFIDSLKHIKCELTGRYLSVHHPDSSKGHILTLCEVEAYTVDLDRPCPSGYFSDTGFRPCSPCRAGSFIKDGQCHVCERGTYSTQDRATECLDCPSGHTTYKPDTSKCYGPILEGNYYGYWLTRYTQVPDLGVAKDNLDGFKATVGDWELFDLDYYRDRHGQINHGQHMTHTSRTVNSIKPIITNKFCYAPRDLGASYTGYRTTTVSGKTCQKWSAQSPHTHSYGSVGNHNFCRNPDNSPEGPWCYTTDAGTRWEYCDIPKCSNDVDCYLEEGMTYMGTVARTDDGQVCDNWPGESQNYCRNRAGYGMPKPWCYKSGHKKACAVDKCKQDCGDPNSGLWGRFMARNSGLCMEVSGTHTSIRENVQLHRCQVPHHSTTDHVWKMDSEGFIINRKTNYCVNVEGFQKTNPEQNINMWTCQYNMDTDQKWEVQWSTFDDCAFRLKNKDTHMCIDAPGQSSRDAGTNLMQNDCEDYQTSDHWWYFIPIQDRACSYDLHENKYIEGNVLGHGDYASLGSAQQACSRLGAQCGGVTRSRSGKHSLRQGPGMKQSPTQEKSWLKGDCKDTHFHYFEQEFMD